MKIMLVPMSISLVLLTACGGSSSPSTANDAPTVAPLPSVESSGPPQVEATAATTLRIGKSVYAGNITSTDALNPTRTEPNVVSIECDSPNSCVASTFSYELELKQSSGDDFAVTSMTESDCGGLEAIAGTATLTASDLKLDFKAQGWDCPASQKIGGTYSFTGTIR